jgi:hypothetical protein
MARRRSPAKGKPWRPPALGGMTVAQLNRLSYVAVEERIDEMVGLLVCEWPRGGNAAGTPVFDDGGAEQEVVVEVGDLQRRLTRRTIPRTLTSDATVRGAGRALQQRQISIGDVYAARLASAPPSAARDLQAFVDEIGVARWITGIVDISGAAREAAKAATYEALTPPLDPKVVSSLREKREAEEEA